jgi:tetratricopeptide (TPR) repeat protein/DNA-binding XRE family transcriptional regulator
VPDQLTAAARSLQAPRPSLGERVRQLRVARGLTQTELASDRFSKEYVSQIERGKTRPTEDTLGWLAVRLGVDRSFLETGVSSSERDRVETVLARAGAALESNNFQEALDELTGLRPALETVAVPALELRALLAEAWARLSLGEVREAIGRLERARALAEAPSFSDVDRAEVVFRLAVCRYQLSSISTAVALFSQALELAERSALPADRLRSNILGWRSRCYRRQRDWEGAREDVERALELAEGLNDRRSVADHYFQASLIAERTGHWVLARSYAERAKAQYEELADQLAVGKMLNNLGGLNFELGKPAEAVKYLKDAYRVLLDVGSDSEAGYVVSSLAQVHLRTGEAALAEEQARHALDLLGDRVDHLAEVGNAELVLGRALLEQDRLDEAQEMFEAAEKSFAQLSSVSHRAAAWLAHGDLAVRRGDDRQAAHLYRRAAEALQDFRF